MSDVIFLVALAMFFALVVGFVRLCDRVISVDAEGDTPGDAATDATVVGEPVVV